MQKFISVSDFKEGLTFDGEPVTYDWTELLQYEIDNTQFNGKPVAFIEQVGGGEGGAPACHTILKIGEYYYKYEYSYYSYYGYDYYDSELKLVTPKLKTITVYE